MKICLFIFTILSLVPLAAQATIDVNNGVPGILNVSGSLSTLAPNVVFVIYGHNLGPSSIVIAPPPNYPVSLSGTSISFTPAAGGAPIAAYMYYTLENAVTGVLPSSTTPGSYQVRVTYNGQTSAPQTVLVVARNFNIATANSAGSGVAQGTLNGGLTLTRLTKTGTLGAFTFSPAYPNDTVSLWGTGGGSDPANDTGGSSGDQTVAGNFRVLLAGRTITPSYTAAVAGYPGLWVLNFAVPADISPDCYASLQVTSNGVGSNVTALPIAATGQSACSDPSLTPAMLARLDSGGSVVGAGFAIVRGINSSPPATGEVASGSFSRWNAAQWAVAAPTRPNLGQCAAYDRTFPLLAQDPAQPGAFLDAGLTLALNGPNLPAGGTFAQFASALGPSYAFIPADGTFRPGRYTVSGNGGSQVAAFSGSANYPASFSVTNFGSIATVGRSSALTINWTGDVGYVTIVFSTSVRGSNNHVVTVSCYVPGGPGGFTVPANVLSGLLVGAGTLSVQGYNLEPFPANLVGGGQVDFANFAAGYTYTKNISVQ